MFWTVSMWNYIGMTAPDYYRLNSFSQQLSTLGPTLTTLALNRPFPSFHTLPSYVKASSLSSLSTLPITRCKTNNFSSTPLYLGSIKHFKVTSSPIRLVEANLEGAQKNMKFSILLLVFFTVLAATRPCFVNSRILQSPTNIEKITHEPIKELQHLKASMNNRILVDNQYHTMTSGPSRRGAGH